MIQISSTQAALVKLEAALARAGLAGTKATLRSEIDKTRKRLAELERLQAKADTANSKLAKEIAAAKKKLAKLNKSHH